MPWYQVWRHGTWTLDLPVVIGYVIPSWRMCLGFGGVGMLDT
jgi:hypothetical protein